MALTITPTAADAMLAGLAAQCDSGTVRLYAGTPPANASAALSGNTLLAEALFGATAFSSSFSTSGSDRVMTANAITADTAANATGNASFFRAFRSDGTTVMCQGSIGTSGADMIMPSTDIIIDGNVSISSIAITLPMV